MYPLYEDEGKDDDSGDPDKPTSRNWRPAHTPALNYNPAYQRQPVLQKIQSQQGQNTHLGVPTVGPGQGRLLRSSMENSGVTRETWGQPVETDCKL